MGLADDRSSRWYDIHKNAPEIATIVASRNFVTVYSTISQEQDVVEKEDDTNITPYGYANIDVTRPNERIDAMDEITARKPGDDG